MRKSAVLTADLGWVALSPFLALFIRDNFVLYPGQLESVIVYSAILVAISAMTFAVTGLTHTLWQYTSLPDVLRIMAAVTVALLLALFAAFALNRLEGVSRSMPVIQWLLVVAAMIGTRIAVRIGHERTKRESSMTATARVQPMLIVGASHLTELYLQSVAEYASNCIEVVGILSDRRHLRGRSLRQQKILGTPEELPRIMAQLETHGVTLERIAVMQPIGELSRPAREALLEAERTSRVRVDWLIEDLGLTDVELGSQERSLEPSSQDTHSRLALPATEEEPLTLGRYGYGKRILDVSIALLLIVVLAPVACIVALLVALDVGLPLVFWQKRPGRFGRPFKLFKFRTMHAGHDAQGNRVPDEARSSKLGHLLRKIRLDELPQLYNILVGEMSFVGPRPLLPLDQPAVASPRLLVRPGLTGLAQVHGGRDILVEDKNTLDLWYIRNASLWLDIKILLRTLVVLRGGERVDHDMVRVAREGLDRPKAQTRRLPSHGIEATNQEIIRPVG